MHQLKQLFVYFRSDNGLIQLKIRTTNKVNTSNTVFTFVSTYMNWSTDILQTSNIGFHLKVTTYRVDILKENSRKKHLKLASAKMKLFKHTCMSDINISLAWHFYLFGFWPLLEVSISFQKIQEPWSSFLILQFNCQPSNTHSVTSSKPKFILTKN